MGSYGGHTREYLDGYFPGVGKDKFLRLPFHSPVSLLEDGL